MARIKGETSLAEPKRCLGKASFQELIAQGWIGWASSAISRGDQLFYLFLFSTRQHPLEEPTVIRQC